MVGVSIKSGKNAGEKKRRGKNKRVVGHGLPKQIVNDLIMEFISFFFINIVTSVGLEWLVCV